MNFLPRRRRRALVDLNITPLVDMVFILLLFFLVTTTFVHNRGFRVDLPRAEAAVVQPTTDSVLIAIDANGNLAAGGRRLDLTELEQLLRARRTETPTPLIILQADSTAEHGKVVEVMDLARRLGFADLAIATEKPAGR